MLSYMKTVQIKVELVQTFGIAKRMERLDLSPLCIPVKPERRQVILLANSQVLERQRRVMSIEHCAIVFRTPEERHPPYVAPPEIGTIAW